MKTLFFLLCTIVFAHAQSSDKPLVSRKDITSFKVQNGELIWQKVYDTPVTLADYEKFIRIKACLEDITVSDGIILGKLRKFKLNFDGFKDGIFDTDVPPYMKLNLILGDVKIDIKDDKYRVTVYNLNLQCHTPGPLCRMNEITSLDTFYYRGFKKAKPRENFFVYDDPILHKNFNGFFLYKADDADF